MIIKSNKKDSIEHVAMNPVTDFDKDDSLALLYAENSKLNKVSIKLFGERVISFLEHSYFEDLHAYPVKSYPSSRRILLPPVDLDKERDKGLYETIRNRRSAKTFAGDGYVLKTKQLSEILYYSYGVSKKVQMTKEGEKKDVYLGFRNVPSGGALYPLEIYVVLIHGELDQGLYHYRPDLHALEGIRDGNFADEVSEISGATTYNVDANAANAFVIITSMFDRTMVKYGERGYRFILLETGFVSQNMSLLCEASGLSSCMFGGYLDNDINRFLGINSPKETVQNVMIIGKQLQAK